MVAGPGCGSAAGRFQVGHTKVAADSEKLQELVAHGAALLVNDKGELPADVE